MIRYIKAFDEDRSDLACAYARNAVFSYRIHELAPATSLTHLKSDTFASKLASRNTSGGSFFVSFIVPLHDLNPYDFAGSHDRLGVMQSRLEIVNSLLSLGLLHKFYAQDDAIVDYDFAYLDPTNDVLLICYAEIVDMQQGHKLSLDQSFILRRKERDEEDR